MLFPDLTIDEELKGKTSSWSFSSKKDLPNNIFWKGKYTGKLVDEILVSDFDYCLWAMDNLGNGDYISTHPIYLDYVAKKQQDKDDVINSATIVKVGDVITIDFNRNGYNPNEDYTTCWTSGIYGNVNIIVVCDGVKKVDGRFPYLMPMINGKMQRVKNKSIEVTVTEVIDTNLDYNNEVYQKIKIKN